MRYCKRRVGCESVARRVMVCRGAGIDGKEGWSRESVRGNGAEELMESIAVCSTEAENVENTVGDVFG